MPKRPQKAAMTPKQLDKLMRDAGVETQRALAEMLGVDKSTVWRWMHGKKPILAAPAALIREKLKPKS